MAKTKKPLCQVTIINEGDAPIAVFPRRLKTRVELHEGERATFEGKAIHIEPALIIHRLPQK